MAVNPRPADHRRALAERNLAAILDAAEHLLERGAPATVSAVAAESGVSRVTVYAHFPTREQLLEALVERNIRAAAAQIDQAGLDAASPADALDRLVARGWRALDHHRAVARAAAEQLRGHLLHDVHEPALAVVHRLVDRGREEGCFRTDVPAAWLVASIYGLFHTAAEEVRAGRLETAAVPDVLRTTLRALFLARSPDPEPQVKE
ncbi:MAG TPA: helix-turn-helix domain-containing protein [Candidatus Dormibacteraeota bacterium]|nr:helix-turn-helix domain-containing protein [Candidatus Dormibacteraeota bacterium]